MSSQQAIAPPAPPSTALATAAPREPTVHGDELIVKSAVLQFVQRGLSKCNQMVASDIMQGVRLTHYAIGDADFYETYAQVGSSIIMGDGSLIVQGLNGIQAVSVDSLDAAEQHCVLGRPAPVVTMISATPRFLGFTNLEARVQCAAEQQTAPVVTQPPNLPTGASSGHALVAPPAPSPTVSTAAAAARSARNIAVEAAATATQAAHTASTAAAAASQAAITASTAAAEAAAIRAAARAARVPDTNPATMAADAVDALAAAAAAADAATAGGAAHTAAVAAFAATGASTSAAGQANNAETDSVQDMLQQGGYVGFKRPRNT